MILRPNFDQISLEGLYNRRRGLLMSEPHGLHSVTSCWNPDCSSCNQWKTWAQELAEVGRQIEARTITNKKA